MPRHFRIWAGAALLLALMAWTNPSESDYILWAKQQGMDQSKHAWEKIGIALLGKRMIQEATSKRNYIFFTLYRTDFVIKKFHVIGIFKHFFLYRTEKDETILRRIFGPQRTEGETDGQKD